MNMDRVLEIIAEVSTFGDKHNPYGLEPFWSGFEQACEEIVVRLRRAERGDDP